MELTVPTFVFFGIGGSPEYHTSNYDGTFTLLQSCPVPSSFKPRSVDAADFDGDGKDDLVIGTDRVNYVMFSSSNQFCDFIPLDLGSDAFLDRYDEVEAADMDNDGNIDIMVVGSFGTKKFLKNGESGSAQDTLISVPPPSSGSLNPSAICLYDFDGDGFLDAVESYKNSEGPVALHLNDKKGVLKFEKFIHGTVGQYLNCEIADLDGDGDMDVVVGKLFGNVAILRNEGNLNFTPIELNGSEGYVGIGDFNNDGNIDIVTQESYGQSEKGATYIWKNNGSGEFVRDEELFSTETASTQLITFDLDEDGRLDIILATFEDGAFVFMNNGYGSLTPPSFTEIGTSTGIPNIFGMALMDPITNSMSPSLTPSVSTSPSVSPVQLHSAAPSLQPSSSPVQAKSGKKTKKKRGKGSKKSSKSGKS